MAISFHRQGEVLWPRPKPIQQLTTAQFEAMFPDEEACCAYLVARRWPNGVHCPRCGAVVSSKLPDHAVALAVLGVRA